MDYIKTPKVEHVRMLDRFSKQPSMGTLYVTTTHLIFMDQDTQKETWILYMTIGTIEKLPLSTTGSPLLIRTKTFLSVTFVIPKERDCHDLYSSLHKLSQPGQYRDLYCFTYKDDVLEKMPWNQDGLHIEYERMGVPNTYWTVTTLNQHYELCETYPRYLIVPTTATDNVLWGSARFRSKNRLPALSYLHRTNGASITRCSQPLGGFKGRCLDDETLFHRIKETNPTSTVMYVVDTRPMINAMANRATGKGYENEAFYENIKFHFFGIENIHVMRTSLAKIVEICEQKNLTMSGFLNGLESSGWLRHIKSILDTAQFIAQTIQDGINVLVHCSDGWDRTAQVCSLAALLLDPYYRTVAGFRALCEKDWLAFGHKFSDRCEHVINSTGDSKEVSPIFTQLLDCTWQLLEQLPSAFEFNEKLLVTLHDHVYSCQYGTFVGNSEKERNDLQLGTRTYSVWNYISANNSDFLNPLYEPDTYPTVLNPNLIPQNITFWRGMYCRFETGIHPREPETDILLATLNHTQSMDDHITYLTKTISSMTSFLSKKFESGLNKMTQNNGTTDHNKLVYDKNTDHPLNPDYLPEVGEEIPSPSSSGTNLGQDLFGNLVKGLESVAIDWKPLRNTQECTCSTYFRHLNQKTHCRSCGNLFCVRCIPKKAILPGYADKKAVPVCKPCYENLTTANSSQ